MSNLNIKNICINSDGDSKKGSIHFRKNYTTHIDPVYNVSADKFISVFIPSEIGTNLKMTIDIENNGTEDLNGKIEVEETPKGNIFGNSGSNIKSFKSGIKETLILDFNGYYLNNVSHKDKTEKVEGKLKFKFIPAIGNEEEIVTIDYASYILYRAPMSPWKTTIENYDINNINYVWIDLLDICVNAYNNYKGIQTDPELKHLEAFTTALNENPNFIYDTTNGSTNYATSNREIKLSKFIKDNNSGSHILNCADCATIVSTQARLVGIDCTMGIMISNLGGFGCNQIQAIGFNNPLDWKKPFSGGFSYHQVAINGQDERNSLSKIYDSCLKLDIGDFPGLDYDATKNPKNPYIPQGYTFSETKNIKVNVSTSSPYKKQFYRERLVADGQECSLLSSVYIVTGLSNDFTASKGDLFSLDDPFIKIIMKRYNLEKNILPVRGAYDDFSSFPLFEDYFDNNTLEVIKDDKYEKIFSIIESGKNIEIIVNYALDEDMAYKTLIRELSSYTNGGIESYELGDIGFKIDDTLVIFVKSNIITTVNGNGAKRVAEILSEQIR